MADLLRFFAFYVNDLTFKFNNGGGLLSSVFLFHFSFLYKRYSFRLPIDVKFDNCHTKTLFTDGHNYVGHYGNIIMLY